jgi:seryl-tRNA synthetase
MLDLKFIRENPDAVRAAVKHKHEKADVDRILALDAETRRIQSEVDTLRGELNKASEEVKQRKMAQQPADDLIAKNREIGARIKAGQEKLRAVEGERDELLRWVPNIPAADVPVAEGAEGNAEVRRWGVPRPFGFKPKAHWDLGAALKLFDDTRASKLSGSNFILFTGRGARLERALINFMLDLHTRKHGYTEIAPPYLVNRASMVGTGQVPKLEADMYRLPDDDLFLIPTAEVPVTNIHRDDVLKAEQLPVRYTAYSACFRREAGAYGKDTRGLVRVHQFDKVELVKFVHPDTSYDELEKLVLNAEAVLQALGLPYRVVTLSTGDLSFASAKTYDLEAWAPGLDRWLEVSSCSNFEAFQARRANIRFRDTDGKMKHVHTLNGSGLALPRVVIALLETYQEADGSVAIPTALRPYMDGMERLAPGA